MQAPRTRRSAFGRLLLAGVLPLLLLWSLPLSVLAAEEPAEPATVRLSKGHRRWLERDVWALISDFERNAFKAMPDGDSRDRFIEGFWQARDPTPETSTNQRQLQHERRLADARERFDSKESSRSDRSRFWILLGPPGARHRYEATGELNAAELWLYKMRPNQPVPAFFYLLFVQPGADAEFRLYDPSGDGPESFLTNASGPSDSQRARALSLLEAQSPELRRATLSLFPGENPRPDALVPSPGSKLLVGRLLDLPNRLTVDLGYVARAVSAGSSPAASAVADFPLRSIFHPVYSEHTGPAMAYTLEVEPDHMTLAGSADSVFGALEIVGGARTVPGRALGQIERRVEINLPTEAFQRIKRLPFAYQDMVSLVPGSYGVNLLVRNAVTGEATPVASSVEIPAPAAAGEMKLWSLMLASRAVVAGESTDLRPYRLAGFELFPVLDGVVSAAGTLSLVFQLSYDSAAYEYGHPFRIRYVVLQEDEEILGGFSRLTANPAYDAGWLTGMERLPVEEFTPGSYRVRVELMDERGNSDAGEMEFQVEAEVSVPQPWMYVSRPPADAVMEAERARQYHALGQMDQARRSYEKVMSLLPREGETRLVVADMELVARNYERVVEVLEPLEAREQGGFLVAYYQGLAARGLGQLEEAAVYFLRAAAMAPRSTRVLNALGEAAVEAGEPTRARQAWQQSLAIDKEQPQVRNLLRKLGR